MKGHKLGKKTLIQIHNERVSMTFEFDLTTTTTIIQKKKHIDFFFPDKVFDSVIEMTND